jgi:anti-sigma-K factor RskA
MSTSLRMRRSLEDLDRALAEQAEAERRRAEAVKREAELRAQRRALQRTHKRGTWRFAGLVLVLVLTAVLVTVAMFQTLYLVMG